jgi:uncharacterized Tic20 family protein
MTENDQSTQSRPPLTRNDETMWGMFCHLSTFLGFIIPFGNIIGPLVIWLLKRDEYAFVDDQGKEALNFQLTITIYFIIAALLVLVIIGIPLLIALVILDMVVTVMGIVRSSEGFPYRYPLSIRFIL